MKNIIKNKLAQTCQTKEMNDEEYMKLAYMLEKQLLSKYLDGFIIASNDKLYNDYKDMFDEVNVIQRKIYNLIFKNGWQVLEMEAEKNIMKKINLFDKKLKYLEKNKE